MPCAWTSARTRPSLYAAATACRPAVHAQLREQVLDVRRDRFRAEEERARDLRLRLPVREELQDLELPRAQGDRRSWRGLSVGRGRPGAPQRAANPCQELPGVDRLRGGRRRTRTSSPARSRSIRDRLTSSPRTQGAAARRPPPRPAPPAPGRPRASPAQPRRIALIDLPTGDPPLTLRWHLRTRRQKLIAVRVRSAACRSTT